MFNRQPPPAFRQVAIKTLQRLLPLSTHLIIVSSLGYHWPRMNQMDAFESIHETTLHHEQRPQRTQFSPSELHVFSLIISE